MNKSLPYVRLSGFYLFYFALLGTLVPYWSLYLQSFDMTSQSIGLLMAMLHLSRVVAPNIWGWVADKTGQRIRVVRYGAFLTWVIFIAIFWQTSALGIGVVMLQDLGYSRGRIGQLWAVGVVAEVLLFMLIPRLFQRFTLRLIMLLSLLLCTLRWLLIALYPEQPGLLLFAQLLHAASFGSLHAVGIALVYHYFSHATQGRGQALFASAGFGAGGAAGAMLSGLFWDVWGGQGTFLAAALISLLAMALAFWWIYPERVKRLD